MVTTAAVNEADVESIPTVVVLRLQWRSRHLCSLVSSALFRDYLFGRPLPQQDTVVTLRLFDQKAVHSDVLACTAPPQDLFSAAAVLTCDARTSVHLIPALPPWLPFMFNENHSRLTALICHSLKHQYSGHCQNTTPLSVKVPRVFLLRASRGSGKTSAVIRAANESHAVLVRASSSYILPRAASASALNKVLRSLVRTAVAAASVSSGGAIILLDDADFLFPPMSDGSVQLGFSSTLPPISDIVRSASVPVTFVLTASTAIHDSVRHCADVVFTGNAETEHESGAILKTMHNPDAVDVTEQVKHLSLDNRMATSQRWQKIQNKLPGTEHALRLLRRVMLRDEYQGGGVSPPRAVLLYGAPGTGKTALVRAAAEATRRRVLSVDAAQLAHGEVGESEARLRQAFAKARRHHNGRCLLFFDEVDALFGTGGAHGARLVATFAQCLDTSEDVAVVAATNRPWMVAKSLRRAGRFDHCVRVGLPGAEQRRRIARLYGERMGVDNDVVNYLSSAAASAQVDGMSAADIVGVCRNAAMAALWRQDVVGQGDVAQVFDSSAGKSHTSVSRDDAIVMDGWQND